ncbi:MAG TPA: hypothetical protein VIG24_19560 [Acidimicrobiia bacterium]
MNENLRTVLDASDDLLDDIRRQTSKLDIVMSALYEQVEDDPDDEELPGMLRDASEHATNALAGLMAFRDYLADIAKEIL